MSGENNDQVFCRELAFRSDPLFRLSHVFADKQDQRRLVALYALFAAIGESVFAVSDESVTERKLAWWRNEVNLLVAGEGAHPVSAELQRCGTASDLPARLLEDMLDSAQTWLTAPSIPDTAALERLCANTGLPLVQLELLVCGVPSVDAVAVEGAAVRRGLYHLVQGSRRGESDPNFWWIPLDLLARHGLARGSLSDPSCSAAVGALTRDLLGLDKLGKAVEFGKITDISNKKQHLKNFYSYDSVLVNKLKYTKKNTHIGRSDTWPRMKLGDLVAAWRAARRVSLLK